MVGCKKYFTLFISILMPLAFMRCGGDSTTSSPPPSNEPTEGGKVHALEVSRYTTANLDNTTLDGILRDATTILQTKDGETDVACKVVLTRQGDVATFTEGNGAINSEADFKTLLALPGHVKIINEINWCGTFKPNVIGCAPTPGTSFIAVRHHPSQEGILWNHEFGHNKGQTHREDPNAIMHEFIDLTHTHLNEAECSALMR